MPYTLTDKQQAQLNDSTAVESLPTDMCGGLVLDGFDQTTIFHEAVGLPVGNDWGEIPSVSERLLRGKLLIEEVCETLTAMGLSLIIKNSAGYTVEVEPTDSVDVVHIEGSRYDPIETADGIADIKVIANGTAVSFGIPQPIVDIEVWASNMSKLDAEGNPIVNRCKYWENEEVASYKETVEETRAYCSFQLRGEECTDVSHLINPAQPVGKVLKPDSYMPANIARLYVENTNGEA